ncbi:MAG: rhomboid family intramembrane serine protease [Candidatus Melainabacteria bacterium]|nr:rhomboid family intramembrane serine protease [Candidatus Melainabacteria bacterium]
MIPIKDNLRYTSFAWVSVTIFALNVLMYIGEMTLENPGILHSTITSWLPVREVLTQGVADGDPWLILRSIAAVFLGMFLHSNFAHIFGNMFFFFAFAPALEARMGHGKFLAFYLVSGVMATVMFLATDTSGIGHILGASGAIGGVLGAYVVYFPRARIDGLTPTFNFVSTLSVFFLAEYLVMQWLSLSMEIGTGQAAGVAFSAHIGGMAFGMVVAALMLVGDVGRARLRDMLFYGLALLAVAGAIVQPGLIGLPYWMWHVSAIALVVFVWASFFQPSYSGWWKKLGTPVAVLIAAYLIDFAVERGVAFFHLQMGILQAVNAYAVALLLMVASVAIAIACRRLPVVKASPVTVPVPKEEDRLLAEIACDCVVGAFRFIAVQVQAGVALVKTGWQIAVQWARPVLTQAGRAIASGYDRFAPAWLKATVRFVVRACLLLAGMAMAVVRFLKLDRLARLGLVAYTGVRNRLTMAGS